MQRFDELAIDDRRIRVYKPRSFPPIEGSDDDGGILYTRGVRITRIRPVSSPFPTWNSLELSGGVGRWLGDVYRTSIG